MGGGAGGGGSVLNGKGWSAGGGWSGVEMGGEGGEGRVLKESDDGEGTGEFLTDGLMDAEHEEGVAAEVEEVVSDVDGRKAESALPDDGKALFHGAARRRGYPGWGGGGMEDR